MNYLLISFLLLTSIVFAQSDESMTEFERLINLDQNQEIESGDINEMLKIIDVLKVEKPDLALVYLEKIKLNIEENHYYENWAGYCAQINYIYRGKSQTKKAEKIISGIYNKYEKYLSDKNKIKLLFLQSEISNSLLKFKESKTMIDKVLPEVKDSFYIASFLYLNASNHLKLGNSTKAIDNCLEALEIYKSLDDINNTATTYDQLNLIYQEIDDYKKALGYSKKALNLALKSDYPDNIMLSYANIGINYKNLKMYDSAQYAYGKSIHYAKKYNNGFRLAQNYMNLGDIYVDLKNYNSAEKYFKASLKICDSLDIQQGKMYNYLGLGRKYVETKEHKKAEAAFDSALYYTNKLDASPQIEKDIYQGLYKISEANGNYKEALEQLKKHIEIEHSVNVEQTRKEIAEIQTKYDVTLKDAELKNISHKYKLKKSQNKALISISILVVILTITIVWFLVDRNKKLRLLYNKNVELLNIIQFPIVDKSLQSTENENPLKIIFEKLQKLITDEKIYKNPDLTIDKLAKEINTNQKYVSSAIAEYTNMNFNNFINYFRIKEAKQMILNNEYPTLNEIIYASGFNSRTPFYNAFNKFTGMSPKKFKEIAQSIRSKKRNL